MYFFYKMDNLIETIYSDPVFRFNLRRIGFNNNPIDFVMGEKVIVLTSIDSMLSEKIKKGMTGTIDNIMHRYKGEPAEHYEFWVSTPGGRSRFDCSDILKYDKVKQFIEEYEKQ
tara:strand:+ start:67 stop:408 length:342 start_codon:yes stop_codon:yes gene_type:complete